MNYQNEQNGQNGQNSGYPPTQRPGYPGGRNGGYPPNYPPNYPPRKSGGNTGLIVAISIISAILVIAVVFTVLIMTDVISIGKHEAPQAQQAEVQQEQQAQQSQSNEVRPQNTQPAQAAPQPIPVGASMYIGNCNVSVTLRTAPDENSSEICQVPLGEEIYVVEYTDSAFARVRYTGREGYIKRSYIVSTRPQVYSYDSAAVAAFVENAVYAFVNGVNTASDAYVPQYYSGSEATQESKSVLEIASKVQSEEVLSLSCHSVTRVSATQVSVIRDSTIRVVYNDGSVKDVTERYKYFVDISGSSYKIVDLKKA
ncbi:MAG: SH3 domain-containing protein [Clostridia bacterium]|nr:SH3 domain-containing protein [Clostridia bacterium]